MKKIVLKVEGATCHHCEKRIEDAVLKAKNVFGSKASYKDGQVEIFYEGEIDVEEIERNIESEGYRVI